MAILTNRNLRIDNWSMDGCNQKGLESRWC